ncbi:hypothetical protein M409DRAFT_16354 [Zasmidium cellare ATCC 36951]|uniref:Uncharacterized protein n=1 Tax=Zasmidium cellare ATCC 36951 TaxID=1080233 RepID=A0A6A6D3U0_ZASCE|nr:uncharacterized protein M409DRAFT_16354 [Zasmidium cellare ATCC 36951]KAF2174081.1 hypothetical protein M409DRAFT_16354 [Zasmidium cellare ATCC 36951]
MSQQANIHVVKKDNITEHATVPISYSTPSLEDGSILIRSALVSLTANNLSYAHLGAVLNWWDAYTVPSSLPAPYSDDSQYGIVPVWGYAEILESKISGLTPGQILFGFWPSHDLPVALRLKSADDCPGHFIEITDSRQNLMNLYNRYILRPDITPSSVSASTPQTDSLAWQSIFLGAGRYISRYVFGSPPIHPGLGSLPWTAEDADMSQAVIVSLSASGKTARVFQDALVGEREDKDGPLGWIGVTAGNGKGLIPQTKRFETKIVGYEDITSETLMRWIEGLKPKRLIIIDFASRGTSLQTLMTTLQSTPSLGSLPLTIIGVGSESKPHKPSDVTATLQSRAKMPNRVQMNMSGIRDRAIELLGAEKVFREGQKYWEGFMKRGGVEGMRLEWGSGIGGNEGIEGGWTRLCEQAVPSDVGMVFRV